MKKLILFSAIGAVLIVAGVVFAQVGPGPWTSYGNGYFSQFYNAGMGTQAMGAVMGPTSGFPQGPATKATSFGAWTAVPLAPRPSMDATTTPIRSQAVELVELEPPV